MPKMPKTKSTKVPLLKRLFHRPTLQEAIIAIILIVFYIPFLQTSIKILLYPYLYDLIGFIKYRDSLPQVVYFPILRHFPLLALAWLPGFLIFCASLFLAKLVEIDAKKAWRLTLVYLFTAPLFFQILYYNILAKHYLLWLGTDLTNFYLSTNTIRGFIQSYFLFGYWPWTVSFIALLIFKKSFYKAKPQKKSYKKIVILSLCFLIPPLLFTGSMFLISRHVDDGLAEIKNKIDFTVYQPTYMPKYYHQEPKYRLTSVNNRQRVISILDADVYQVDSLKNHLGFITLNQFKQDSAATLGAYFSAPATASATTIPLPAATDHTGLLRSWNDFLILTYITDTNTVISLVAVNNSLDELLKFSAGLKKY